MPRSRPIILTNVTAQEREKILAGLRKYAYIQQHRENSEEFRRMFASFYFVPRNVISREDQNTFFDAMFDRPAPTDPFAFASKVQSRGANKNYFSFATKAVHTFNTNEPIYDSHVVYYLKEQIGLMLKTYYSGDTFEVNWPIIKEWYGEFLNTEECDAWVAWFDENFPDYTWISKTKKVDFIIYALGVE